MKPRAALHQSAPSAIARAMSKAVTILPETADADALAQAPTPISALRTKTRPSRIGMPRWSANSSGAAPVPPSLPSTTMKSGRMPVSSIALQIAEKLPGMADAELEADRLAAATARAVAR